MADPEAVAGLKVKRPMDYDDVVCDYRKRTGDRSHPGQERHQIVIQPASAVISIHRQRMLREKNAEPRVRKYPKLGLADAFKPGISGKVMVAIFFATLTVTAAWILGVLL